MKSRCRWASPPIRVQLRHPPPCQNPAMSGTGDDTGATRPENTGTTTRRGETTELWPYWRIDDLIIDLRRGTVTRGGRDLKLPKLSLDLLICLMRRAPDPVDTDTLLQEVWGVPGDLQTRTVDMTISNLRHKIERVSNRPRIVVTVKGVGYAWGANGDG